MTTADEADQRKRVERARETGLFRYSLVQELLEPGLSQAERGWRARELAGRVHEGPGGRRVTVSYSTLTRWRRRYEEGGFDALVPSPRQPAPRTPKKERPSSPRPSLEPTEIIVKNVPPCVARDGAPRHFGLSSGPTHGRAGRKNGQV